MKVVILRCDKIVKGQKKKAGEPVSIDNVVANAWINSGDAIDPQDKNEEVDTSYTNSHKEEIAKLNKKVAKYSNMLIRYQREAIQNLGEQFNITSDDEKAFSNFLDGKKPKMMTNIEKLEDMVLTLAKKIDTLEKDEVKEEVQE